MIVHPLMIADHMTIVHMIAVLLVQLHLVALRPLHVLHRRVVALLVVVAEEIKFKNKIKKTSRNTRLFYFLVSFNEKFLVFTTKSF